MSTNGITETQEALDRARARALALKAELRAANDEVWRLMSVRDAELADLVEGGASLSEAAARYGITKQGAHRVMLRLGRLQ